VWLSREVGFLLALPNSVGGTFFSGSCSVECFLIFVILILCFMSSTLLQLLLCQELVELVRTKKLAQAAAASAKKN